MIIEDIQSNIILDSRGEKTIETQLQTEHFSVKASVPAGKSKGGYETSSKEPNKAIEKLELIKHEILGFNFNSQKSFDKRLLEIDGSKDKSNLGGNLILSLSLAFARANAKSKKIELWEYINAEFTKEHGPRKTNFPFMIFNVINGGVHSSPSEEWMMRNGKPKLSIQEFQIIPTVNDMPMALSMGKELYKKLREKLVKRFGAENIEMGDEAGFIAPFKGDDDALDTLYELIREFNYPARIGLDVASSQLFEHEKYSFEGKEYSSFQAIEYYKKLINRYNIISIEDPFDENDFRSFSVLEKEIKDNEVRIITDDLTTTNPSRIKKATEENSGNTLLVKPNQIGTLTEALRAVSISYDSNWKTITSHRSGETTDDFIADLAVGIGSWGIKSGAPATPFRLSKYDRLVEIYQSLSNFNL